MTYCVNITHRAHKQLGKLDAHARTLLYAFMHKHLEGCENPRVIGDGKKLEGTSNGWCWRVGSYRIIATILDSELVIEIVQIGHRQGIYRGF